MKFSATSPDMMMGERLDYLTTRDLYNRCEDEEFRKRRKLDIDDHVPENTRRNNLWAINTWNSWSHSKKIGDTMEIPVASQLPHLSARELNDLLCRFVYEVRRYDGSEYPPNSLYQLCCGLVRYLKNDCSRSDLNFLDSGDPTFNRFQITLNSEMKRLTEKGVGAVKRKVRRVTEIQEEVLWKRGMLGAKDAWTLVKTIYFYNCKLFGIYGRDDHRSLEANHFYIGRDDIGDFVELQVLPGQRSPGVKRQTGRSGRIYDEAKNPDSLFKFYKKYLNLVPRTGPLYRKPAPSSDNPQELIFSQWPIGVNSLCAFVPNLMKEAGFEGFYTGHSVKVQNKDDDERQPPRSESSDEKPPSLPGVPSQHQEQIQQNHPQDLPHHHPQPPQPHQDDIKEEQDVPPPQPQDQGRQIAFFRPWLDS